LGRFPNFKIFLEKLNTCANHPMSQPSRHVSLNTVAIALSMAVPRGLGADSQWFAMPDKFSWLTQAFPAERKLMGFQLKTNDLANSKKLDNRKRRRLNQGAKVNFH
jgi:hypothetical protein